MSALSVNDLSEFSARTSRPRGFAPWSPRDAQLRLVADVQAVLDEYKKYLPLTARQVFYRLVGTAGFPKTESDYKRLCETLNRARRAGFISFDHIRDDGFTRRQRNCYSSADEVVAAVRATVDRFTIDRQQFQPRRIAVWCEAAGMVEMLTTVTHEYCIPVFSSGGFDSVTIKHELGFELSELGLVDVLHIGDHDPSGVHAFLSLAEDVRAFAGGNATFYRVAVNEDHIQKYDLPTAPPKSTDARRFHGRTAQAEALPPDLLCSILAAAIRDRVDPAIHAKTLEIEREARERLREQFDV